MDFKQIDKIADSVFPLFAIALILTAIVVQKGASWLFILRTVVAVVLCQQIAKAIQKMHLFDHTVTALQTEHGIRAQFPSSHMVVVLCIATAFFLLNKRFLWVSIVVPILYGALMLYQQYHTPLEMLAAVYAIPVTWGLHLIGAKREATLT
jgi:hypothetical protein